MHILLVADGRSAITRNWINVLQPMGYRISLVSTYPTEPPEGSELAAILPVAFARFGGSQAGNGVSAGGKKRLTSYFRPLLGRLRHRLGPWTLPRYRRQFRKIVDELKPDLVHALRIPYEGMLAAATPKSIPLVVSTWGNDFTLHAPASPRMGKLTRQTLTRADALMSDTQRDTVLAREWGFGSDKPALVVVGNGGIDLDAVREVSARVRRVQPVQIINPRGLRSYVRTDTFFKAIPLVLAEHPEVQFVCPNMAGQKEALDWVEKLGIGGNVRLLPKLLQRSLWEEFARSTISVSLSEHDGTPNSLLEAMAFGCLPVCGDLDSIRAWIQPGVNGELADPADEQAVAGLIHTLLDEPEKYAQYRDVNQKLVEERADKAKILPSLRDFYIHLQE